MKICGCQGSRFVNVFVAACAALLATGCGGGGSVTGAESPASSADKTKLVATVDGGAGYIYTSIDSGVTWTERESPPTWNTVASSAEGVKLVAAVFTGGGQMYTSADSGLTWTPRDTNRNWYSVSSSADGNTLLASDNGTGVGRLYTSTDSGITWVLRERVRLWRGTAISADGTRMAAGVNTSCLYTFVKNDRTTPGTAGSLGGSQYDSVDLRYFGADTFIVRAHTSYSGTFAVR